MTQRLDMALAKIRRLQLLEVLILDFLMISPTASLLLACRMAIRFSIIAVNLDMTVYQYSHTLSGMTVRIKRQWPTALCFCEERKCRIESFVSISPVSPSKYVMSTSCLGKRCSILA